MHPQHILITGGAGYVGSHTVLRLCQRYQVTVLDNLSCGHRELIPDNVAFCQIDLRNRSGITTLLQRQRFDAVVHFAARAYVGESMTNPGLYFENNVTGTQNLLDAMVTAGVPKLVFSSSCAVYGTPQGMLTEEHPTLPINPYGESKLIAEKMLAWYGQAHGLRYVALRYFNAAGADARARTGEWHDPEPHLIPRLIAAAITGRPFATYGTDFATRDGSCVRDFIHVADLAAAHEAALRYLDHGGRSAPMNLGTGTGVSVLEAVAHTEALLRRTIMVRAEPRRPGDPAELVASVGRACTDLQWEPRHSSFAEILRTALAWHQRPSAARQTRAAGA